MIFEVHAGAAYRLSIVPALQALGASVVEPLAGLSIGRQLAWYRANAGTAETAQIAAVRRQRVTAAEVRRTMRALDNAPVRVAAIDWPAELRDLGQPGLYSWWVDEPGAQMLSRGLGQPVAPGRIYAGQTGATKWPSGRAAVTTLAAQIGSNHLSGRIAGSTFRLTLASILTEQLQLRKAGLGRLDHSSERRLSEWMRNHLQVAVHPSPDRDALADLEQHVLAQLDPPLNLEGRAPTPVPARLAELRRQLRAGCRADSVSGVTFDELIDFVKNRMSMSHVYQPLVIRALADADGAATLRQLAVALAAQDEAVLAEAEATLKKMPLRVLSKHQVITYDPKTLARAAERRKAVARAESDPASPLRAETRRLSRSPRDGHFGLPAD